MRLHFTPDYVTAGPSCGIPQRAPHGEASAPFATDKGARVYLTSDNISEQVDALAAAMFAMPEAQIAIRPEHLFSDGVYSRTVRLAAGTVSVGYRHKQAHICIVSQGRCRVVTDDDDREIDAPAIFTVPVGARNCVHAITNTVWSTIHAISNGMRDVAEIETMLVGHPVKMIGKLP